MNVSFVGFVAPKESPMGVVRKSASSWGARIIASWLTFFVQRLFEFITEDK